MGNEELRAKPLILQCPHFGSKKVVVFKLKVGCVVVVTTAARLGWIVIVVCTGAVSSNNVEKTMLPDCVWILQAWLVYVSERKGGERGERRSRGWNRVGCRSDYCG